MRMLRTLLSLSCLTALSLGALTACTEARDVPGSTWQVSNLWLRAEEPSELPVASRGVATLAFGEGSLAGFSGCVPFQAAITFAEERSRLHINDLETDTPRPECTHDFVHSELMNLLQAGHSFEVEQPEDTLLILRLISGDDTPAAQIDRPAIGLAAL